MNVSKNRTCCILSAGYRTAPQIRTAHALCGTGVDPFVRPSEWAITVIYSNHWSDGLLHIVNWSEWTDVGQISVLCNTEAASCCGNRTIPEITIQLAYDTAGPACCVSSVTWRGENPITRPHTGLQTAREEFYCMPGFLANTLPKKKPGSNVMVQCLSGIL